jgi:hypothetical protein
MDSTDDRSCVSVPPLIPIRGGAFPMRDAGKALRVVSPNGKDASYGNQ